MTSRPLRDTVCAVSPLAWTAVLAAAAVLVLGASLVAALVSAARRVYGEYRAAGGSILRFEPAARGSRGRGALILAPGEIVFERYFPRARVRIPIDRLLGAEAARPAGTSPFARGELLVIHREESGAERRDRFAVHDAEAWLETLRRAAGPCPALRT